MRIQQALRQGISVSSKNPHISTDLIIVGGGLSGICTAITALRNNPDLSVRLIDESEHLGQGVAYATTDPDHRLNGPTAVHSLVPTDLLHLSRWCHENEIIDDDPDATTRYGLFIRRGDYAKYMQELLPDAVAHTRARAESIRVNPADGCELTTNDGQHIRAKAIVLAVGNPAQHVPKPMQAFAEHAGVITDPWDRAAIGAVNPDASVLIVGSSLTAADQICSLLGQGHRGAIQVISRNGLRPTLWPLPPKNAPVLDIESVVNDPPETWIQETLDESPTIRALTRVVRQRIKTLRDQNEPWAPAFEEVRNKVWQIWPQFSAKEKQRFIRRLRPYYDIYRFRTPPQTAQILAGAESAGQLSFRQASLTEVDLKGDALSVGLKHLGQSSTETFDVLINCTGFDMAAPPAPDSLCAGLVSDGHLSRDPSGIGFQTDQHGRCRDQFGNYQDLLRMVGPQTAGTWGDPLSVIFIGLQVRRMMPNLLATLTERER
jgi:uncharacterized NAD(P)/FAD-binding protein YdhS